MSPEKLTAIKAAIVAARTTVDHPLQVACAEVIAKGTATHFQEDPYAIGYARGAMDMANKIIESISLADVLTAMNDVFSGETGRLQYAIKNHPFMIGYLSFEQEDLPARLEYFWNTETDFDGQSEETKSFLHSILVANKE